MELCCLPVVWPEAKRGHGYLLQKDLCQFPGLVYSVPLTLGQATLDPKLCWRLLDNHRQVWLSVLWCHYSFLLGSEHISFFCALKESASPVLWNFCNKIPLAFKVKFPVGFSPFDGWEIFSVVKQTYLFVCLSIYPSIYLSVFLQKGSIFVF